MSPVKTLLSLVAAAVAVTGVWLAAQGRDDSAPPAQTLLNVSYDVSRELWRDMNAAFKTDYERRTGRTPSIEQSHAGSSSQARSVVDGLEADVVTLNLFTDTDLLRQKGMIPDGWEKRLPNRSLPYTSTVVFVVRRGNPHAIRDWPDLVQPGVTAITPNPKTSGLGKLAFLAAWASVVRRGGTEAEALQLVRTLFTRMPVLDSGGRAATVSFSQKGLGDVHLTFENEAYLEVQEAEGALELVHPPISLQAEPFVAWVDANVERHQTQELAREYLEFLYSDAGQEIVARHFLRPIDEALRESRQDRFPSIELVHIDQIAVDWPDAVRRFFAEGAVFDQIMQPPAEGIPSP